MKISFLKKNKKAKIIYFLFLSLLFFIFIVSRLFISKELYDFHPYERITRSSLYHVFLNDEQYEVKIENSLHPLNHTNPKDFFTKPYVIVNHLGKNKREYIVFLYGGPVTDNPFLSLVKERNFEEIITEYLQFYFLEFLEEYNIIFIDDRVNDLFEILSCQTILINQEDFVQKNYRNLEINCKKSLETIRKSLSDYADVEDINHILKKEGVNKAHIIGDSFGAWRGLNFIENYPEKAISFSSLYGDIFQNIYEVAYKKEILKNIDLLSEDPSYGWPLSEKPSKFSEKIDIYLKENLSKMEYYEFLKQQFETDNFGYLSLGKVFYERDEEETGKFYVDIPPAREEIFIGIVEFIRNCNRLTRAKNMASGYLDYAENKICESLYEGEEKLPYMDFHIPDHMPIQVIHGALDIITAGIPEKNTAISSLNMGVIVHEDAFHGGHTCVEEDNQSLKEFLSSLKPVTKRNRCGKWKFYNEYDNEEISNFMEVSFPPAIRRLDWEGFLQP